MASDYRGTVYRENYPVVDGFEGRADGRMWVLSVQEDLTREVNDLLMSRYGEQYSISTGDGKPILEF